MLRLRQAEKPEEALALLMGKGATDYESLSGVIGSMVKVSHDNAHARGVLGASLYAQSNAIGTG